MYFTKATGLAIALLVAGAKQALANPAVESTIDTTNMERSDADELVSASHVLREEDSVYERDFIGQFDESELAARGFIQGAIKAVGKPHRRGVISGAKKVIKGVVKPQRRNVFSITHKAIKGAGKPHRRGVISSELAARGFIQGAIKAVGKPHRRGVISSELAARGFIQGAIKAVGKPRRRGVISGAKKVIKGVVKPQRRGVISGAKKVIKGVVRP